MFSSDDGSDEESQPMNDDGDHQIQNCYPGDDNDQPHSEVAVSFVEPLSIRVNLYHYMTNIVAKVLLLW